jgi:GNAT superfamily N-acetyltransferase
MTTHPPHHNRLPSDISVRHRLDPGDFGAIVSLHGLLYAREYGYDTTFEAYVAAPLVQFVLSESPRKRIWVVEKGGKIVGSLAVVDASPDEAQLRWFLLDPNIRGLGIGRLLLDEALSFCRAAGYSRAFLLTVDIHTEAAALYLSAGFVLTDQHEKQLWGETRMEQRYDVRL